MIVPYDQLHPATLAALIEEFVTRDGAVHGHHDVPTDRAAAQVQRLLRAGKMHVVFDEADETCNLVTAEELERGPTEQQASDGHADADADFVPDADFAPEEDA